MTRKTWMIVMSFSAAAAGCSAESEPSLSGRIAASTFPETVTSVEAIGNNTTASARVGADGSFALNVPAGDRYRIVAVSATHRAELVFPRRTGAIDSTVYVASSAAFDLGQVRYVADATSQTYDFELGSCTNGLDANGNPCTSDSGTGGSGDSGTSAGGDTGTGGTGDTGTGGSGDTGTGGGQDSGGGGQDSGGTCGADTSSPPSSGTEGDGAVAEHTPDDAVGCDNGTGGGQDTGGGGNDPGTGTGS